MARDQVGQVSLDDTDVSPWNHWKGPRTAHDTVSLTIRIREVAACLGLRTRPIPFPLLCSTSVESQRNQKQQQVKSLEEGKCKVERPEQPISTFSCLYTGTWLARPGMGKRENNLVFKRREIKEICFQIYCFY